MKGLPLLILFVLGGCASVSALMGERLPVNSSGVAWGEWRGCVIEDRAIPFCEGKIVNGKENGSVGLEFSLDADGYTFRYTSDDQTRVVESQETRERVEIAETEAGAGVLEKAIDTAAGALIP